jgi:hypothetical protein
VPAKQIIKFEFIFEVITLAITLLTHCKTCVIGRSQQILTPGSWQVSINKHSKTINFQEHSVISSKNVKNLRLVEHYINKSRL